MNTNTDFQMQFMGIGAPRCGTTWLSKCLAEHPDICFSEEKEAHFFDRPHNRSQGLEFYASYFACNNEAKVKGEFTPAYYLSVDIATDVKQLFPEVKLIVMLRDPVRRFESDLEYYARRNGVLPDIDALISEKDSRFIDAGMYYKHLQAFLSLYTPDQYLVVFYEEIFSDPQIHLRDVFQFLQVDSDFVPSILKQKVNASNTFSFRAPFINRIVNTRKVIKKNQFGHFIITILKTMGVNVVIKKILKINMKKGKYEKNIFLSDAQLHKLKCLYADDTHQLSLFLGRELPQKWGT